MRVKETETIEKSQLPDIYYIIFDSYANSSTLKELWDFDNHEFTDYLTDKAVAFIKGDRIFIDGEEKTRDTTKPFFLFLSHYGVHKPFAPPDQNAELTNHEKYIKEAIYSVLGQTFSDFELIIINCTNLSPYIFFLFSLHDPMI